MKYHETSRQARHGLDSTSLDYQILVTIAKHGPCICHDIEHVLARSHQSVSGNLRHLVERGLVVETKQFGKTPSGRKAKKWALTKDESLLMVRKVHGKTLIIGRSRND